MKTIVSIEGMTCDHCVARVTNALSKVAGVTKVKVEWKKNQALLQGDAVSEPGLRQAVEDAGYIVKSVQSA